MFCEKTNTGTIKSTFTLPLKQGTAEVIQRGLLAGEDADARALAGYNPGSWKGEVINDYLERAKAAVLDKMDPEHRETAQRLPFSVRQLSPDQQKELRERAFVEGSDANGRPLFDFKLNRIAFSLGGRIPGSKNGGDMGCGEGLIKVMAEPTSAVDRREVTPDLLEKLFSLGQIEELYGNVITLTELSELDEKK